MFYAECGHTLLYRVSLFRTSRTLLCLQIEGLWQLCVEQVYQLRFSSSICSFGVSESHFANSRYISNFFSIITFVKVICDFLKLLW